MPLKKYDISVIVSTVVHMGTVESEYLEDAWIKAKKFARKLQGKRLVNASDLDVDIELYFEGIDNIVLSDGTEYTPAKWRD